MATRNIADILVDGPVVPMIVVEDVARVVPLARALVAGGVRVLEVTLRTEAGLESIRRMIAEVPEAIVGAGTVLTGAQLDEVAKLGAAFAVSPGVTPSLLDAAAGSPVPLLPGTATASEVMVVLERGYSYMKLFPAEAVGGVDLLSSLASPLPAARFALPAASTPRRPSATWRSGTWSASAARGSCRAMPYGTVIGPASPALPAAPLSCARMPPDDGSRPPRRLGKRSGPMPGQGVHLRDLFAHDPQRLARFSPRLDDLLLDYSENRVNAETMQLLLDLARPTDIEGWRTKMFEGAPISVTEGRAVLHTALRNRSGRLVLVDGADAMPEIDAVLAKAAPDGGAHHLGGLAGRPHPCVIQPRRLHRAIGTPARGREHEQARPAASRRVPPEPGEPLPRLDRHWPGREGLGRGSDRRSVATVGASPP